MIEADTASIERPLLERLGVAASAIWIAGGTGYFIVQFSMAFYRANQSAVDRLLSLILG